MEIVCLSWWSLCLVLIFISHSACQFLCSEFRSPLSIETVGTSVGTIQVPMSETGNYRNNQLCEWNIVTSIDDYVIRLDVKKSNLQDRDIKGECNNDYVEIFDYVKGNIVVMDRFCGSESGTSYLTSGNKMTIRFYSDNYLEFTGFVALYQPVHAGPSKDQQEEDNKKILNMAVGIPVGVLVLIVIVIISLFLVRYCRRKKATRPPQTAAQNPAPPRLGLSGGHTSGTSTSTGPPNYYHNSRAGSSEFFPRNVPLQVILPGSAQDGSRASRSITPPPAYDSLDFDSSGLEHSGMPLTPPPYEVIVKQYMGPSNE